MEKEIWKELVGNKKYEISNKGNIRHKGGESLKIQYNVYGYSQVVLYDNNNKPKSVRIHREVLKAFKPIENEEEKIKKYILEKI